MIIVRSLATFQADFPDDSVADDFDVVLCGGKNVAEAIRAILLSEGCTDDKLRYGGAHGWELTFAYRGYPLWMQIVQLDHYILNCKESPGFGDGSDSAPHLNILQMLNEKLRRDGRFRDIVWYRHQDYSGNNEGSDLPFEQVVSPPQSAKPKDGVLNSMLSAFRGRPKSDG